MKILQLINDQRPLEYLDPGSGSILIQMIIAALAGITVTIGIFWKRLKKMWFKLLGKEIEESEDLQSKE